MGGAKKQSPAQAEKSQQAEAAKKEGRQKKSEKKDQKSKSSISVIINEDQAMNFIKGAKVFTVQEVARQEGIKISAANSFLQKQLKNGLVRRIGGYSGHHVYTSA